MLWTLLVSSLLLTGRVLGQQVCVSGTSKQQSGDNNYVIDYFSDALLFTYATNQCTAVDLLNDQKYVKYTCSKSGDTWWVTKQTYTTSTCTGTSVSSTWDENTAEPGQLYYFNCAGNENYAKIQIGVDSGCAGSLPIYGGLGGCAQNPGVLDVKFYCNSTNALVQLFVNPDDINATGILPMCSDALYCNKWNFRTSCALSATFAGNLVYGKMLTCETNADPVATTTEGEATTTKEGDTTTTKAATTTDDTMTTSSTKAFSVLCAVVALVVGLFY